MAVIVIVLVGAVLRLMYLGELSQQPGLDNPPVDAGFSLYWARGLATDDWTLPPDSGGRDPAIRSTAYQRSPGYPFVLAALYAVSDGNALALRAWQMFFGLLTVVMVWWFGRRLAGPLVGLVWSAVMAIHWGFIYFEGGLHDSWLLILLLVVLGIAVLRLAHRGDITSAAAVGAIVGLTSLVRANYLVLGPVLACWMFCVIGRNRDRASAIRTIAVAAIAGTIVLSPCAIRNLRVSGHLVLVAANGGLTLFHGNNPDAHGISASARTTTGFYSSPWQHRDLIELVSAETGERVDFTETCRFFGRRAWDWIAENPSQAAVLAGRRILLFWGPHEIAHNHAVAADRRESAVLRWLPFPFSTVLAGAILGIGLRWRRRKANRQPISPEGNALLALAMIVGGIFVSYVPFFVTSLYRIPIVPFLLLAGSLGFAELLAWLRDRRYRAFGIALAVGVMIWLFTRIPWIPVDPGIAKRHNQLGRQWQIANRPDLAAVEFRAALAANPDSVAGSKGLAVIALAEGRPKNALSYLETALRRSPHDPEIHYNIGLAQVDLTRWKEAAMSFARAVELAPSLVDAHLNHAVSCERLGDYASAITSYERTVALDPGRLEACNNLAWLLATAPVSDLRDGQRAVNLASAVVDSLRNATTLDTLAAAFAESGRFDEAVAAAENAIQICTDEEKKAKIAARRDMYLRGETFTVSKGSRLENQALESKSEAP